MSERQARRRERLIRGFRKQQIDALLVRSESNVSYLTGFTGDSSVLVLMPDRALMVSDGRYTEQLQRECPEIEAHIRPVSQLMVPCLAEVLKTLGLKRVGFEPEHLCVADYDELKGQAEGVELRPVSGRVEALRALKDRIEVQAIRLAIESAERAFTIARAGLRLDETEKDLADLIEAAMRRTGASGASFPPIVAVGEHAALPHYRPSEATALGQADFVLIDWGATRGGYKSDLTRVLVTGKVTSKFTNVYRSVLSAQQQAIAVIRPGVKAGEVDRVARSALEEAGFGPYFEHGLGHGLGLEIHEAPRLRKDSETLLQAGMVITIEPGVYLPGWGGIRIEDDILVTPDGHEVLTHVPRELETVRLEWADP